MAVNVGAMEAAMVTLIVAVVAHCPTVGVNVYTVVPAVAVLIVAGLQLPLIPF